MTLSSEADRSKYKVWDYPIKEKYSHMLETIEKNGMVKTREDGYQRVLDTLDGTFAFIDESARVTLYLKSDILVESNIEFKNIDEHSCLVCNTFYFSKVRYEYYNNCNFTQIGDAFGEQPYAVAVQQGSYLNEELSRSILRLQKQLYFEKLSGT